MANDPLFSSTRWSDASDASDADAWGSGGGGFTSAFEAGMVLAGKYRLERPAGFGGMGAVWVARNESTNAEVAVKILVTSREGVDEEQVTRFRREAHAAAQLSHRGIVRVFDLIELHAEDSGPRPALPAALVMVMELLRGETLASLFDKKRRFTLEETTAIVLPLLSALAHAHAQGIVHRDVKPENVFLSTDPDGHVTPKILDFGISKLNHPAAPRITTDGATLGTPSYMSPEQARGMPDVDARSDVFAAGILLYEMLSGQNPFASGSYHSVVAAVLERDPLPLADVPPDVWRVVRRALEKPPALRYADAGELASALRSATLGLGVPMPDVSGAYPPQRAVSMGDRSVPPAPYREPEMTRPSLYVKAKRQARLRAALIVGAVVASLGAAVGVYSRVSRVGRAPAAQQSASVPAAPVAVRSTASAAPPRLLPPAPAFATAAVPVPTMSPSSSPSATAHRAPATPPAHVASRPARLAPPPSPAARAADPPPPSPPRSTVVRDPGF